MFCALISGIFLVRHLNGLGMMLLDFLGDAEGKDDVADLLNWWN